VRHASHRCFTLGCYVRRQLASSADACRGYRGYYAYSIDVAQPGARPADAYSPTVTVAKAAADVVSPAPAAAALVTASPTGAGAGSTDSGGANAQASTSTSTAISRSEIAQHQTSDSLWCVVDEEWVVDVTDFIPSHPGGEKIFTATAGSRFSFSSGPNAHFGTTKQVFKAACASFARLEQEEPQQQEQQEGAGEATAPTRLTVNVEFWRSRVNGGLDRNGGETGAQPSTPQGIVTIIGRLAKTSL
jgi:hypothetical protein